MFLSSETVIRHKMTQHHAFLLETEINTPTHPLCNCGKGVGSGTPASLCLCPSVAVCDWQEMEQPWALGCPVAALGGSGSTKNLNITSSTALFGLWSADFTDP